jgi:hypothetical protein
MVAILLRYILSNTREDPDMSIFLSLGIQFRCCKLFGV